MTQKESQSTNSKTEEASPSHHLLRSRWNGKSGYKVYYVPVLKEEARRYVADMKGPVLRKRCGDKIEYIKEVLEGEVLMEERGTHNLPKKWKAPARGCEVKIQKRSCV